LRVNFGSFVLIFLTNKAKEDEESFAKYDKTIKDKDSEIN